MLGGSGGTNALGRYPPQTGVSQPTDYCCCCCCCYRHGHRVMPYHCHGSCCIIATCHIMSACRIMNTFHIIAACHPIAWTAQLLDAISSPRVMPHCCGVCPAPGPTLMLMLVLVLVLVFLCVVLLRCVCRCGRVHDRPARAGRLLTATAVAAVAVVVVWQRRLEEGLRSCSSSE
eukprot:COSAG06_NODE_13167_length_1286_cov_3.967987_1_plen_174_part_00